MIPEVAFLFRDYLYHAKEHDVSEHKLPLAIALPLIAIMSAGLWFGIWKAVAAIFF